MGAIVSLVVAMLFVAYPLVSDLASTRTNGSSAPVPGLTGSVKSRIATIERQASGLRMLKPLRPVTVALLSNGKFSRKVSALLNTGLSPRDLTINDQEWVLTGLIPPKTNIRKILTGGIASMVAGWYSYKAKRLYIRDTGQALGIDRWYIAHEYTHALQDQHFDLRKMEPDETHWRIHNSDAQLAVHSLIEGDAVTIQYAYEQKYYTSSEKAALFRQEQSLRTARVPRTIQESFDFPYTAGPTYVQLLLRQGGYARVDHVFRHPPETTFQLMFPGQSVRVIRVRLGHVMGLFRSWHVLDDDVNGAFGDQQLVELYAGNVEAGTLAHLWRGDRYVLLRKGHRYAMLMRSMYSSATDRQRATAILEQALATRFQGLRAFPGGQWGGRAGLFGAIHIDGNEITLAFSRSGGVVRALSLAPTT